MPLDRLGFGLDDDDDIPDTDTGLIVFPPEVEEALAQVFPSDDPLDQPDFNPVDYINNLFPSEQSLTHLDDVIAEMKCRITGIDDEIRSIVRNQTHSGQDAAAALEEAQNAIIQLFTQIRDIKNKASESEAMVRDITRDIKQLDTAKRNLTTAITTLNHLHMLVGGVTTLQNLTKQRQYGEVAMLLQGLMEVLDHFKNYTDIPQIKELSDQVNLVRRDLGEQITKDFHDALSGDNVKNFSPNRQLAEACLVVAVLDPKVKKTLLKWLMDQQLAEYKIMFVETEECAWLDKIDNRYNWLKRHLIEFEERMGPMFPPDWEMSERIAVEFCDLTRKDLEKIMFKRKHEIDTKLLLHVIQRTGNFESLLNRRFSGVTLDQYEKRKVEEKQKAEQSSNPFEEPITDESNPFFDDMNKQDQAASVKGASGADPIDNIPNLTPFQGIISQCFEPYLHIYIESQDRNLSDLIERAATEQRNQGHRNLAVEGSAVLHSCGDLFMFYKKCMMQCAQLSTGEPMLALTNVFKKYLREYASKILVSNLPKISTSQNTLQSVTANITKDLKDFSTTGLIQNFQNLLKEGEIIRLTDDERVLVCTLLLTAEYCLETTQQLEGKLKDKVDQDFVDRINLTPEQDVYHGVITNCIQILVQELEASCEPALIAMIKMSWSTIESVGDQSPYVTSIVNHMKQSIPLIRDNLASSRKYFTQFCVKFVNNFIPKFLQHVYKCKPINTVGAEQLLLDTHSLKTLLLDLPSVGSKSGARKAPASYTKIVVKGMTRAEMTLKVVMSPSDPISAFIEQFIKLVPEADASEFQKVLDMKGIRKVDQNQYIEMYRTKAPKTVQVAEESSAAASPVHAASTAQLSVGGAAAAAEESRIKKLEKLIKKRL